MATISRSRSPAPNVARITTSSPAPYSPSVTGPATSVSSSSRNSLEIPTPVSGIGSNASNAPGQRRNRAALRDYYNLKAKGQGAGPGTLSRKDSTASNISISTTTSATLPDTGTNGSILPSQLDDPSFDPEEYVKTVLADAGLKDILALESTLVFEIRNLDGERKALVYDNYSKLIKAVSTIAEMQQEMNAGTRGINGNGNSAIPTLQIQGQPIVRSGLLNGTTKSSPSDLGEVEQLHTKIEKLVEDMRQFGARIGPAQAAENERQKARRKADRQLRRQKQLVQWVLDSPDRLQGLLDEDKREEAESEWTTVQGYLDKWNGTAGVEDVRRSCEEIMNRKVSTDSREDDQQQEEDEADVQEQYQEQDDDDSDEKSSDPKKRSIDTDHNNDNDSPG